MVWQCNVLAVRIASLTHTQVGSTSHILRLICNESCASTVDSTRIVYFLLQQAGEQTSKLETTIRASCRTDEQTNKHENSKVTIGPIGRTARLASKMSLIFCYRLNLKVIIFISWLHTNRRCLLTLHNEVLLAHKVSVQTTTKYGRELYPNRKWYGHKVSRWSSQRQTHHVYTPTQPMAPSMQSLLISMGLTSWGK